MTPRIGAKSAATLAGLVVLAVSLRIAAIAYTHAASVPAEENRIIARNLATGHGFTFTEFGVTGPTAIRGPVYPMLLAVLGPDRTTLALVVNVIAGAATVLAVFVLVRRLLASSIPLPVARFGTPSRVCVGEDTAWNTKPCHPEVTPHDASINSKSLPKTSAAPPWVAAAFFAVWPTQLYAATLTQGLSIAVLLTATSLALAFRRTPVAALAGGALAGLAALTEPALALPLLLVAIAIGGRSHWRAAALYVAAGGVIVAPWLYRNAIVFGRPMPITSNFWRDAFVANGPEPADVAAAVGSSVRGAPPISQSRVQRLPPADFDRLKRPEADRIDVLRGWTTDWIRRHPGEYLRRCLRRVGVIVTGNYEHRLAGHAWFALSYGVLFILAAWIAWPWFASGVRTTVLWLFAGLALPMIFVMADARMLPLLDVPLLLACSDNYFSGRQPRPKAAA